VLTSLPVTGSARPLVHAPVAISGFAVSFLIDDGNSQQVTKLNLTPLLLAKLLTNSYTGNTSTEPALAGNPSSLFTDPEFTAVNPGFTIFRDSFPSDVNMVMLGARRPVRHDLGADQLPQRRPGSAGVAGRRAGRLQRHDGQSGLPGLRGCRSWPPTSWTSSANRMTIPASGRARRSIDAGPTAVLPARSTTSRTPRSPC